MKNLKKMAVFGVMLAALPLIAETETVNGVEWTYTIENGGAFLGPSSSRAIPTSTSGEISIPATLGGHPVVHICHRAFWSCDGITSIVIPNSVTNIGEYAFEKCYGLTNITIPESVTNIGHGAFEGCDRLSEFIVATDNPSYRVISGLLLTGDGATIVAVPRGMGHVTIPDSVTTIEEWLFSGYTNLLSVVIGNGVACIERSAFEDCCCLTNVIIGSNVKCIGFRSFFRCSNLSEVSIPDSVEYIHDGAFAGCTNLTSVTIGNGVTDIGMAAFGGCSSIMRVVVPQTLIESSLRNGFQSILSSHSELTVELSENVTNISSYAFYNCKNLVSITIPESVTSIEDNAFNGCVNLATVEIPNSVTSIGDNVFDKCFGLTSVTIPDSVSSIGKSVFSDCTNLVSIIIPDGVKGIGDGAFYGCSGLTSVTLPDTLACIGRYAFKDCVGLETMTIPDSVTNIGEIAFHGCIGLKHVTIPQVCVDGDWGRNFRSIFQGYSDLMVVLSEGVTNICDWAFASCTNLIDVTISSSVTSIRDFAFYGCSGLTNVTISGNETHIGRDVFEGCRSLNYDLTTISGVKMVDGWVVSAERALSGDLDLTGARGIASYAFSYCDNLTSVTIPNSVKSISEFAFSGCYNLRSVYISDLATWCCITQESSPFYALHGVVWTDGLLVWKYEGGDLYFNGSLVTDLVIPEGVMEIGDGSFYNCCCITNVTIPSCVTNIGRFAFQDCGGLRSFVVDSRNAYYSSVNGLLLSKDGKLLMHGVNGNAVIPDGVENIGDWAFSDCGVGLASITMPDTVTNIGQYAFAGCYGLTSVFFSGNAPKVGGSAFRSASTNCVAYVSPESTGWGVIEGERWNGLVLKYVDRVVADGVECIISDGSLVGVNPNGATEVTIPECVKSIGDFAFYNCRGLTNVTMPGSITNIGCSAFRDCSGLTSITIPDGVVGIGDYAFYGCRSLTNITMHDSIANIGCSAFRDCCGLTTFSIPDGVMNICSYMFYGCSNLVSVTIPSSVTSIGDYAFRGCCGLTSVYVSFGDVDRVKGLMEESGFDVGGVMFIDGTIAHVVFDANGGIVDEASRDVDVGSAVGELPTPTWNGHAFDGWWTAASGGAKIVASRIVTGDVTYYAHWRDFEWSYEESDDGGITVMGVSPASGDVVIPSEIVGKSVTSIGAWAFYGCNDLTSVTMPNTVTNIGNCAFRDCRGLTNVTIGTGVMDIGEMAFAWCDRLTSITIPDNVGDIGREVFADCHSLENIVFGSGVTNIGYNAFARCEGLTSVDIPNSVVRIGMSAFEGCNGIVDLTISDSVESIGDCAFYGCGNLTNVTIPDSVANIGYGAFVSCYSLRHVTIPQSGIESCSWSGGFASMFGGFSDLVIVLSENVTNVCDSAFENFNGLLSVTISDSVTRIGDWAFCNCSELISVTIPGSVVSIGHGAFIGCCSLTNATIRSGVVSIGGQAFEYCDSLRHVTIPDSVSSIGEMAFHNLYELREVVIGNSVTNIGYSAFEFCYNLASVTIPASVVNVGERAFEACDNLRSVTFLGNAPVVGEDCFKDVDSTIVVYVNKYSTGWGVDIPGIWNGMRIEYLPMAPVAADATPSVVADAIDDAGFPDADAVKAVIGGSALEYGKFKSWAGSVKDIGGVEIAGEAAVVANTNAAAAYLLGAERLFENAPRVEIGEVVMGNGERGADRPATSRGVQEMDMSVSVVVKDGDEAVRCEAEKVALMFEATSDIGDWNGAAKIPLCVEVAGGGGSTGVDPNEYDSDTSQQAHAMHFRVTLGEENASQAFLRIRK